MTVRILVTGDLHIGRRPTRLAHPDRAERASAARMWQAIIDRAIAEKVDAVLLSGDVVDHDNRFYEATGPLERGMRQLAEATIPTFAVAGNHDWDVFPRILNQLETGRFQFLGRDGQWQAGILQRDGDVKPVLRIVGWSFPARHVQRSPLTGFQIEADPEIPTVGLLHTDVDGASSDYAPVDLSALQACDLDIWVLGHVHKPQFWDSQTGAKVLYPGSPQALNPGESGVHGPWLISLEGAGRVECRQLPMSRVRYDRCEVDVSEIDTPEGFETRVNETLMSFLKDISPEEELLEVLSLRMDFVGATPLCTRIDKLAESICDLERSYDKVVGRIDKWTNQTRPAINLDELVRRKDPTGLLARTLVALEQDESDPSLEKMISDATTRLKEVCQAPAYVPLVDSGPPADRSLAREILIQQVRHLLDTLCRQRPDFQEGDA